MSPSEPSGAYELAMFPLEHPVVPGQVIPLMLFEPRYLALADALALADEPDFGIVGIERGREVGGDDVRSDVGVVARVLELGALPDGRRSLVATGTRRVRIETWLDDDPYPRALVRDWPDDLVDGLPAAVAELAAAVTALLDLARRRQPDLDLELPPTDPDHLDTTVWRLVAFAGLGPLDIASLLRTPDAVTRAHEAAVLIDDRRSLLDALDGDDL
jgi:Lon protease-like protein